jgi:prophage antirepressor-like protein
MILQDCRSKQKDGKTFYVARDICKKFAISWFGAMTLAKKNIPDEDYFTDYCATGTGLRPAILLSEHGVLKLAAFGTNSAANSYFKSKIASI